MPENNALAELAHWLECDTITLETASVAQLNRIRKASRIVSELAKVGFYNNIYGDLFARSEEARDTLVRCYKIAEEGAGDGK